MKQKDRFGSGVLTGILISLAIVLIVAAGLIVARQSTAYASRSADNSWSTRYGVRDNTTRNKLALLQDYIDAYSLYAPDKKEVADSLFYALVDSLGDPYSTYYNEEDFQDFIESSTGQYKGIGVIVSQNPDTLEIEVLEVYTESPAEEVGMLAGDILKAVDGEDITRMQLNDVVGLIRGEEGTSVTVTVYRPKEDKSYDLQMERREVKVNTVYTMMLDEKIGYLELTEFDVVSPDQFTAGMQKLYDEGMKGLVLDLRGNPGGDLDSLLAIAEQIMPEGTILTIDYTVYGEEVYTATGEHELQIPLVVLVDGNTASAAEVLTGAIKDHKKGTIIGTQTFGKGIVQTIFPIGDDTAIKLTVADYYTPSGANIHGVGIAPDIVLEPDPEAEEDNQLAAAMEEIEKQLEEKDSKKTDFFKPAA